MPLLRSVLYTAGFAVSLGAFAAPMGTGFTYQGRLSDAGEPATGLYDLQLCLFDALSGGVAVACAAEFDDVPVEAGLFALDVDFGLSPLLDDQQRYLELRVRSGAGGGAYTTLTPRQALRRVPHATRSASAASADTLDGVPGSDFARRDQANVFTAGNTFAGLSAGGQAITDVAAPSAAGDAANKAYVDAAAAASGAAGGDLAGTYPDPTIAPGAGANVVTAINASAATIDAARLPGALARRDESNVFLGGNTFAAGLSADGQRIVDVADPTLATDAANKAYVDAKTPTGAAGGDLAGTYPAPSIATGAGPGVVAAINASGTTIDAARLPGTLARQDGSNVFTGSNRFDTGLAAGNQRITEVAAPTDATDAVNKTYVDAKTASGAAGGDLAGNYPDPTVAPGAGPNVVAAINASGATIDAARLPGTLARQDGSNVFTGSNRFDAGLAAGNQRITEVAVPTDATDAVNKTYVDAKTASGAAGGDLSGDYPNPTIASTAGSNVVAAINASSATLAAARLPGNVAYRDAANTFSGSNTFSTGLSAGGQRITAVATPSGSTDAANKAYVDGITASGSAGGDLAGSYPNPTIATGAGANLVNAINASSASLAAARLPSTIAYQSGTNVFSGSNTFNAGLSAGSQRITSVATPTDTADAVNKQYADTVAMREMWVEVDSAHTFANLPVTSTFADERHVLNVSNFTQIKLLAQVATAGSAGSLLRVNYQTSAGGWVTLVGHIDLSVVGTQETAYVSIPAGVISKGLIQIAAIASGGDGTASPVVQGVAIMVK